MAKYIEQMTVQQIQAELEREYQRWNHIAANGDRKSTRLNSSH